MSEKESLEDENEEETIENEKEEEITILPSNNYNPKYHSKEFLDKLGEYYNQTQNWSATARMLNRDFGTKIGNNQVRRMYISKVAFHMTQSKEAGEFFEQSFEQIKERWNDAWEMVGDLVKQYKRLKNAISEKGEVEQAMMFMKLSSTIIGIAQQVQKQLEFIQKQQEQIKVQQNTLIYSPLQINQYIGPLLKKLLDDRKIIIPKDSDLSEYGFGIDESKELKDNNSKLLKDNNKLLKGGKDGTSKTKTN